MLMRMTTTEKKDAHKKQEKPPLDKQRKTASKDASPAAKKSKNNSLPVRCLTANVDARHASALVLHHDGCRVVSLRALERLDGVVDVARPAGQDSLQKKKHVHGRKYELPLSKSHQ